MLTSGDRRSAVETFGHLGIALEASSSLHWDSCPALSNSSSLPCLRYGIAIERRFALVETFGLSSAYPQILRTLPWSHSGGVGIDENRNSECPPTLSISATLGNRQWAAPAFNPRRLFVWRFELSSGTLSPVPFL